MLDSGEVMVVGGHGNIGHLESTEFYDPNTDSWRYGPDLPFADFTDPQVPDNTKHPTIKGLRWIILLPFLQRSRASLLQQIIGIGPGPRQAERKAPQTR